jgi:hypothetical protein
VTAQHLRNNPKALFAWWDIAGDSRLCCTMILDALIRLAENDAEPVNRGLGVVAQQFCGLELDKQDPYRMRYGELIGLRAEQWDDVEPGFWQYACKDPIATLLVMKQLERRAAKLIAPWKQHLLPDAKRRFGPLTASLQVQGAIALDYVSRSGIHVDVERTHALHQDLLSSLQDRVTELEEIAGDVFQKYVRTGKHKMSDSGVPRRNAKLIKERLEEIARRSSEPIDPPRNKDGLVTDSIKFWKQHQDADPFISAYVGFSEVGKLLQFFGSLQAERIFPKYIPLKRTGRTSCTKPNLQQIPRDGRFREIFVAPPGYWLLQIDYSVLELRTLAQICLFRFGKSVLADLFREGADPHKYTAALLLGKTLEQFETLPRQEQKRHRQRAKAINFGVPGGLGALSLVSYAKQSYGVEMGLEEAKQFRHRLITEIYPELGRYLWDDPHRILTSNLNCMPGDAKRAFNKRGDLATAMRVISGQSASESGEPYDEDVISNTWDQLRKISRNPSLTDAIRAKIASLDLARRIFWGDAVTISGRLRGHVSFSQRMNTPFQSLAADGNKLALFRLLRHGFRVCGFVHDEMLVLIPDGTDYDAAVARVQEILEGSMRELTPSIPIKTEYILADRWYKDVDEQPRDAQGKIVPYRRGGNDG